MLGTKCLVNVSIGSWYHLGDGLKAGMEDIGLLGSSIVVKMRLGNS